MPVIDHPVHPRTVIGADHKAHCWNKPRPKANGGYWRPARIEQPDGSFIVGSAWQQHWEGMTIPCQYDQAITPEHCAGCEHIRSVNV